MDFQNGLRGPLRRAVNVDPFSPSRDDRALLMFRQALSAAAAKVAWALVRYLVMQRHHEPVFSLILQARDFGRVRFPAIRLEEHPRLLPNPRRLAGVLPPVCRPQEASVKAQAPGPHHPR